MSSSFYRHGSGAVLVINIPSQGAEKSSPQGDGDGRQRSTIRFSEEDRNEILDMAVAGKVTATAPESKGLSTVGWEAFHQAGWAQRHPASLSAHEVLSSFVDLAPGMAENEQCRQNVYAAIPSPEEDDEMAEFVSKDTFEAHMQRIDKSFEDGIQKMALSTEKAIADFRGNVEVKVSEIRGDIKELHASMEGSLKELRAHDEERANEMALLMKTIESTTSEIREDTRSSRTAIWGMAISVILAVVFGALGLIITVTKSNETLIAAIAQIVKAKP